MLEDQTVLFADGTATYSSMTGYEDNTSIPVTTVASLSAIDPDDLLDMQQDAFEDVDGNGEYYMHRNVYFALKKLKDLQDRYIFEIEGNSITLGGAKVNIWNRMHDGSNTGDMVVLYGDTRRAGKIGVGRDMSIDVDTSVDFTKGGLCWRLMCDFGFVVPLPGAVSKLRIVSTT